MTNNIKNLLTKAREHLEKQYMIAKHIIIKKTDKYLCNIPVMKRVKPVYAVIMLSCVAMAAFAVLPSMDSQKALMKPGIDLSAEKNVKKESRGKIDGSDRYLLARVIEGEAANEPMTGKVAVGAVILNRTESSAFPHDVRQVVYQPLAFEAVANGQYNRPLTPDALKAADLAIKGDDPTHGALYYWNPAKSSSDWIWQRPVTMQIGRHVFAK